jgi:alkylation response protein AidB-like acyl-CoA dehydrogenase
MAHEHLREEIRSWLVDHVPAGWREQQAGADVEEFVRFQKWWFDECVAGGWAACHWPKEWGGQALNVTEQAVVHEEMARADAPRLVLHDVSLHHLPATLLTAGSDEQRQRYIPGVLAGEVWCQGFSEPDAGSDLASLRTMAVRDGDHYVVNGQKLWTSGGAWADYCLLLARTDKSVPKHQGISYLILDMRSPGVEVRPIRQAFGGEEFGETFLTDVRIPVTNRIGAEGDGWRIAQTTLTVERSLVVVEVAERMVRVFDRMLTSLRHREVSDGIRLELADCHTEMCAVRSLCTRLVARIEDGTASPADASVVKLAFTDLLRRMSALGLRMDGIDGCREEPLLVSAGYQVGNWMQDYLRSWEWSIAGGTSEIQKTIIAQRGLGLPREVVRR